MQYEQKKKELVEGLPHEDGLIIVGVNKFHQTLDDMARYVRSVMEVEKKDHTKESGERKNETHDYDEFWGCCECYEDKWFNKCRTTAQKQADDSGIPKND